MVESYRITRILVDHFFRRFFDNDTLQVDGDTQTTVVRALSIVAAPEMMITSFYSYCIRRNHCRDPHGM